MTGENHDCPQCPACLHKMDPCINAGEKMQVRAWLCTHCGHTERAIGRERILTADMVGKLNQK